MTRELHDAERIEALLSPLLRQFLRRRYRLLASEHDDLVQQVLEGFLRFLSTHAGSIPPSTEWPAIGLTILKRRIADRFRDSALRAAVAIEELDEDEAQLVDQSAGVDDVVRYRRLLSTVFVLISEMGSADQALLLDEVATPGGPEVAMSSTDRKRLSRLRESLRERLLLKFGVKPEDYFGR